MPTLKPPLHLLSGKPPLHFHMLLNKHAPSIFKAHDTISSSAEGTIKVLKILADTKNLKLGKVIHAQLVIANQASQDHVIQNTSLINLYSKCGQITIARQLFDGMRRRNVVSWCALMVGYFHHGFALEVLKLFKTLVSVDNLCPNEYILTTVLSSCSDSGLLKEGKQCHGYVLKSGLVFHQYVKNALVCMYSMCLDVKEAMRILNSAPGSDLFTYNCILHGLLNHDHLTVALDVLNRMLVECVEWDSVTYVSVFSLCARLKDLKLGLQVHNRMLRTNVECDLYVSSAIIDMYGKCSEISLTRKVFDGLQTRNVVSWTAILAAYLQNECFEEALKLFSDMELEEIKPNEITFAVLLNSSAGLSALGCGNSLHARAEKSGFKDYVTVGNALINMYSKNGNIEAANEVFSDMRYRDSITWNSMISGYSRHGLGKEALTVFHDMLAKKEQPNYVTFVGVLSACGHLGRVQEGFYYLHQLMKQMNIEPGLEHYTCIVGLLSKAGLLDEAEYFMRSTPIQWDVVAWRTLLSACHVYRNYGTGKRVADVVLHMDPNDVGTYVLLSNMHAKAKRWDGVAKIRKLIRERNIKKEPGLSWTEIRNDTHVFVSDDNNHPEFVQIHEKVRELLAKIKLLGYVPDFASVTHDVEEEQKEDYLSYHSEKLAIAYALIKTPTEAPVRVFKNLRMCDDCHSAVKLISKVTDRVIIVRDVNRFHCFQEGWCSCADYW
ncbi:unnamed protein product [Ilex paraguariensis]|uniref:DYW domain-containing protein n=1 Tax=Ilex paraguariensis TaxID=185542 RepID=A0ABC8R9V7_9AQUA